MAPENLTKPLGEPEKDETETIISEINKQYNQLIKSINKGVKITENGVQDTVNRLPPEKDIDEVIEDLEETLNNLETAYGILNIKPPDKKTKESSALDKAWYEKSSDLGNIRDLLERKTRLSLISAVLIHQKDLVEQLKDALVMNPEELAKITKRASSTQEAKEKIMELIAQPRELVFNLVNKRGGIISFKESTEILERADVPSWAKNILKRMFMEGLDDELEMGISPNIKLTKPELPKSGYLIKLRSLDLGEGIIFYPEMTRQEVKEYIKSEIVTILEKEGPLLIKEISTRLEEKLGHATNTHNYLQEMSWGGPSSLLVKDVKNNKKCYRLKIIEEQPDSD